MATRTRGRIGRKVEAPRAPLRVLTAAATTIDMSDRVETRRERALRQGWQILAWTYRDSIGEFRYAVNFLANCTSRMRLFPAMYPEGGEADVPVPLDDKNCPPEVKAATEQALRDLGNGRMAISQMLHTLSTSWSTVGECFLVGQEDEMTQQQTWRIRSNQEIIIYNDEWKLREVPMDPQGILGWVTLDPEDTYIARLWQPHPEFHVLADCPTRALISDMESLQILRRMIRATGRSRLASRGILAIPSEFSISQQIDDNLDATADSFMDDFARAVTTPMVEEGTAAEVVPVVMRGPGDAIKDIRWIEFASQFDQISKDTRAELVGIIATGLDLPKEVITGIADLNHWSAWQVDDNTFRHHVEPHVISCIDALTGGYLRPYLRNCGLSPAVADEWAERCLFWYDATELVTHPDQTADALQLHDRGVISDAALRRTAGFSETDKPTPDQFLAWLISKQRSWPPNVSEAVIHGINPTLKVPAISTPGTIPGIDPALGVVAPEAPAAAPAPSGAPALPAAPSDGAQDATAPPPSVPGPPPISGAAAAAVAALAIDDDDPAVTLLWALRGLSAARLADRGAEVEAIALSAAGAPLVSARDRRLSQRLSKIDADLRLRIQTAADAAMVRVLEKAGSRIVNKVRKDETMRTAIRHTRLSEVGQVLGRDALAAAGLGTDALIPVDAFDDLLIQFANWTEEAQGQALATAVQLAGISPQDKAAQDAALAMQAGIVPAVQMFSDTLHKLAANLLHDPDPAVTTPATDALLGAKTLVPTGTVRAALGVTAGYNEQQFGTIALKDGTTVPGIALGAPIAQVSTSAPLVDLLSNSGAATTGYEWVHGASTRPFDPHENLDGVTFLAFDDPVLANDTGFPDNEFFFPGDHNGCTCDYMPLWASDASGGGAGTDTLEPTDTGGEDTGGDEGAAPEPEPIPEPEAAAPEAEAPVVPEPEVTAESEPTLEYAVDDRGVTHVQYGNTTGRIKPRSGWSVKDPTLTRVMKDVNDSRPGTHVALGEVAVRDQNRGVLAQVNMYRPDEIQTANMAKFKDTGPLSEGWWMPEATRENKPDYIIAHELGHSIHATKFPWGPGQTKFDNDGTRLASEAIARIANEDFGANLTAQDVYAKRAFGLDWNSRPTTFDSVGYVQREGVHNYGVDMGLSRYAQAKGVDECIAECHAAYMFGSRTKVVTELAKIFDWGTK